MRLVSAAFAFLALTLSCSTRTTECSDAPADFGREAPVSDGGPAVVTCPPGPPERCDDGNAINGDGCASSGVVEPGFACLKAGALSVCVPCV